MVARDGADDVTADSTLAAVSALFGAVVVGAVVASGGTADVTSLLEEHPILMDNSGVFSCF